MKVVWWVTKAETKCDPRGYRKKYIDYIHFCFSPTTLETMLLMSIISFTFEARMFTCSSSDSGDTSGDCTLVSSNESSLGNVNSIRGNIPSTSFFVILSIVVMAPSKINLSLLYLFLTIPFINVRSLVFINHLFP